MPHTTATQQTTRQALVSERRKALHLNIVHAWQKSPQETVPTPGFEKKNSTVSEVVFAEISFDDALKHEVMQLLMDASMGKPVAVRASALIAQASSRISNFHAEDSLVEEGLL